MLADTFDVFASRPQNDLLSDRSNNEAYALTQPGQEYAVYFPDGGEVSLDVSFEQEQGSLKVRWLDIRYANWLEPQQLANSGNVTLQTPRVSGGYVAVITHDDSPVSTEYLDSKPAEVELQQNYPNPFNPTTVIRYQIPESRHVNLTVYDMLGQEVATLVNKTMTAGEHHPTGRRCHRNQTTDTESLKSLTYQSE